MEGLHTSIQLSLDLFVNTVKDQRMNVLVYPFANLKDGLNTVRVSSNNKGRKGKTLTLIRD